MYTIAEVFNTPTSNCRVPLEWDDLGLLHIVVRINGQDVRGILDSGCNTIYMPWSVANRLGLHCGKSIKLKLADGSTSEATLCHAQTVEVGNRVLRNVAICVVPDNSDILIGQGVLREFDYSVLRNPDELVLLD
jgi:clan AA aspartic protease (TIGR02281 family)